MGIGKVYITSKKFITADGGFHRIVWMPKELKETLHEQLAKRAEDLGDARLRRQDSRRDVGVTEEEILPFLEEKGHPALYDGPDAGVIEIGVRSCLCVSLRRRCRPVEMQCTTDPGGKEYGDGTERS